MTRLNNCTTDPSEWDADHFAKLYIRELCEFIDLFVEKKLQPRDLLFAAVMVSRIEWRSGRCRTTVARAAEILKIHKTQALSSMRRLKSFNLIVPAVDTQTGEKYHIVNPWLICMGSPRLVGYMRKLFMDAIQDNHSSQITIHEDHEFADTDPDDP